jgi:hypothetical protein
MEHREIRHRLNLFVALTLATGGCATIAPEPETSAATEPRHPPKGECDAGTVQGFVGHKATGEIGAAILATSRARALRWGPPRSAWTMDYRDDRVNVRYDDDMVITSVTCG